MFLARCWSQSIVLLYKHWRGPISLRPVTQLLSTSPGNVLMYIVKSHFRSWRYVVGVVSMVAMDRIYLGNKVPTHKGGVRLYVEPFKAMAAHSEIASPRFWESTTFQEQTHGSRIKIHVYDGFRRKVPHKYVICVWVIYHGCAARWPPLAGSLSRRGP